MSEFSGKVVIITGAGSGNGRGAALLFGRDGARVPIIDRRDVALRETAELVGKEGGEALPPCAGISRATEAETA